MIARGLRPFRYESKRIGRTDCDDGCRALTGDVALQELRLSILPQCVVRVGFGVPAHAREAARHFQCPSSTWVNRRGRIGERRRTRTAGQRLGERVRTPHKLTRDLP